MWCCNDVHAVMTYGTSAYYKAAPSAEQRATGVVPLDSLPAAWWNCMWCDTNSAINEARDAIGSFIDEVNTLLTNANIQPNCNCVDTIYRAINKIRQTVGDASVAGAVKSSSCPGEVSIDANGIMTANCVGNASALTTTARTLTGAVNELKCTYDCCVSDLNSAIGGKAPTNHASSCCDYGVGNSTCYGHVKISDTYTSLVGEACDGVAASQKAVNDLYQLIPTGVGVEWTSCSSGNYSIPIGTCGRGIAEGPQYYKCANCWSSSCLIAPNILLCSGNGASLILACSRYGSQGDVISIRNDLAWRAPIDIYNNDYSSCVECSCGYCTGGGLRIGRIFQCSWSCIWCCSSKGSQSKTITITATTDQFFQSEACDIDPTNIRSYPQQDFTLFPAKYTVGQCYTGATGTSCGACFTTNICFCNNTPFTLCVESAQGVGSCKACAGSTVIGCIKRCTFDYTVGPGQKCDLGCIYACNSIGNVALSNLFVARVCEYEPGGYCFAQPDPFENQLSLITMSGVSYGVGNRCSGIARLYACVSPYGIAFIGHPGTGMPYSI